MPEVLAYVWGLKTHAMLDVWTIEHFLSGISVGGLAARRNRRVLSAVVDSLTPRTLHSINITTLLFFGYLWETIEHYLEIGLAGDVVMYWFQGVEFWANRIIFDPIVMVLGYSIASAKPSLIAPARLCSFVWIVVHVFIFPHSMYLHDIF